MLSENVFPIITIDDLDVKNKRVLVRLDINSPLDFRTKKIVNTERILRSLPTLKKLIRLQAKIVIIAHQGDTLDYQNFIALDQHAKILERLLNQKVTYIDEICGEKAIEIIENLKSGEILLLGNLRYLTEEASTFENYVDLKAEEMLDTLLVRKLVSHFDYYVNDAFSTAHRNAPSMVAFQELLPTAAGELYSEEYKNLSSLQTIRTRPSIFILGGSKISDAFGMMNEVLSKRNVDKILTTGVVGMVFIAASGFALGEKYDEFLLSKGLVKYIDDARQLLKNYSDIISIPIDVAYENNLGQRVEIGLGQLEKVNEMYFDIGSQTINLYTGIIRNSETIFMNGPAGVYEKELFEEGTRMIDKAVVESKAFSVIGGGDTINSASKYINLEMISYVSTAGGAMIQFLSGKKLPLVEAMNKAFKKYSYLKK